MKKIVYLFLMMVMPFSVSAQEEGEYIETQLQEEKKVVQEQGYQTCDGEKPLRIASFMTNPPFGWSEIQRKEEKILYIGKGFNIDFIKRIADENKIYATAVAYPSDDQVIQAFHDGDIDILVGSYYDPKMKLGGHRYIIPALIQNVFTVTFMKGKEKEIKTFNDLIGLKGVVRTDEGFYQYVRLRFPKEAQIEEVPDSRTAFTKLLTGDADYIFGSPYSTEAEARRFKMNTKITMAPNPLVGQELFLLVSRNTACPRLAQKIAVSLREKRNDINAMKIELIDYINKWGQRFKDVPGLVEQLKKDTENKQLSEPSVDASQSDTTI